MKSTVFVDRWAPRCNAGWFSAPVQQFAERHGPYRHVSRLLRRSGPSSTQRWSSSREIRLVPCKQCIPTYAYWNNHGWTSWWSYKDMRTVEFNFLKFKVQRGILGLSLRMLRRCSNELLMLLKIEKKKQITEKRVLWTPGTKPTWSFWVVYARKDWSYGFCPSVSVL